MASQTLNFWANLCRGDRNRSRCVRFILKFPAVPEPFTSQLCVQNLFRHTVLTFPESSVRRVEWRRPLPRGRSAQASNQKRIPISSVHLLYPNPIQSGAVVTAVLRSHGSHRHPNPTRLQSVRRRQVRRLYPGGESTAAYNFVGSMDLLSMRMTSRRTRRTFIPLIP